MARTVKVFFSLAFSMIRWAFVFPPLAKAKRSASGGKRTQAWLRLWRSYIHRNVFVISKNYIGGMSFSLGDVEASDSACIVVSRFRCCQSSSVPRSEERSRPRSMIHTVSSLPQLLSRKHSQGVNVPVHDPKVKLCICQGLL